MMFCAGAGGIAGAKVWYVIEKGDLGSLFSGTGLVFYGGAIGGALAVMAYAKHRDFLDYRLFDMGAPALAIGYAVGRLGCQLAGDGDYGIPSDLPWAMSYPDGTVPTTDTVHPTPVYETLAMGVAGVVLWRMRDRFAPGVLFGLYLIFAGIERFLVEFIRRNEEVVAGLTQPQLISLALLALGVAIVVVRRDVPQPATA
jgi:phosphatidylglycerol:prolipoprotein diacylglycerol transferase